MSGARQALRLRAEVTGDVPGTAMIMAAGLGKRMRPLTATRPKPLIEDRAGVERFGLLDFQDAVAGHPAYDLASVLEDARRDVPEAIERRMIDRYMAASANAQEFEAAYWALAAQRNARILGVFTRLWKRDGKPHYRKFQPRMWGLLERDLAQPSLEPVRDWFDRNVPEQYRRAPWSDAA